jgi:hypothetical protein
MNRETITMDEYGKVFLPYSDEIWMRETELTDLFGIIAPTFRAAVKAIYKGGALKEYNTRQTIRLDNGCLDEVYSIDMVVALAFRFDTFGASQVRKALVERMMSPRKEKQMLVLSFGGKCRNVALS